MNIVENNIFDPLGEVSHPRIEEVFIIWADSVEFEIFNNDWFGPTPEKFFKNFLNEITDTDEDDVVPTCFNSIIHG